MDADTPLTPEDVAEVRRLCGLDAVKIWHGYTEMLQELALRLLADRDRLAAEVAALRGERDQLRRNLAVETDQSEKLRADVLRLEAERDRQYEENVERIAAQAAAEHERDALAAALTKCKNLATNAWLDPATVRWAFESIVTETRAALADADRRAGDAGQGEGA